MADIIIDDEKQCYDFEVMYDVYRYLLKRLEKYGAGSDELSLLTKLWKEADMNILDVQKEIEKRYKKIEDIKAYEYLQGFSAGKARTIQKFVDFMNAP